MPSPPCDTHPTERRRNRQWPRAFTLSTRQTNLTQGFAPTPRLFLVGAAPSSSSCTSKIGDERGPYNRGKGASEQFGIPPINALRILSDNVIIFVHIPKTAGTSFRFILENNFGVSHCHTNHTGKSVFSQTDLDFAQNVFPRLRSIAGHNIIDPLQLSVADPFYITFLREPVSRVISQYQESVLKGKNRRSFEECLRESGDLENLHVKIMAGERNLDKAKRFIEKCGFVGLTEKFDHLFTFWSDSALTN